MGSIETDREVLVGLYNSTGGKNWRMNTNWLTDEPVGEWYGVTVDRDGRVIGLFDRLLDTGNRLEGEIPAGLGNLSKLRWLNLRRNRMTGRIPPELGRLTELEWLDLGSTQVCGEIPPALGNLVNLWNLSIRASRLSGEIPQS